MAPVPFQPSATLYQQTSMVYLGSFSIDENRVGDAVFPAQHQGKGGITQVIPKRIRKPFVHHKMILMKWV